MYRKKISKYLIGLFNDLCKTAPMEVKEVANEVETVLNMNSLADANRTDELTSHIGVYSDIRKQKKSTSETRQERDNRPTSLNT
jgi:hypothetical protein